VHAAADCLKGIETATPPSLPSALRFDPDQKVCDAILQSTKDCQRVATGIG
jgi:hypothetical protein